MTESSFPTMGVQPLPIKAAIVPAQFTDSDGNEQLLVQIFIAKLDGVFTFFLPPTEAEALANAIANLAQQIKKKTGSGLILPSQAGLVIPEPEMPSR